MDFKKYSNGAWIDTPVYKYNKTAAGAPNLILNNITTVSGQGITAVNNNGVITINGTNGSIATWIWIQGGNISGTATFQELGKGKYIIGGVPEDSTSSTYRLFLVHKSTASGTSTSTAIDTTNAPLTIDNTNGDYNYVAMRISITANVVCDNVIFTPFIKPLENSWYQIQAYKRQSGSWTTDPVTGRRRKKVKLVTEEIKDYE